MIGSLSFIAAAVTVALFAPAALAADVRSDVRATPQVDVYVVPHVDVYVDVRSDVRHRSRLVHRGY